MSDFGDISGVAAAKGFDYQKLIAAYYLIVEEVREIEYEADGEDITIINEDSNRNSIEYIQAKCISTGSFTFAKFKTDVFPQFWNAYSEGRKRNPEKAIYCTLITNVSWDSKLKTFVNACEKLYDRGLTLNEFEQSIRVIRRQYDSLKSGKDNDELRRFLWGQKTIPTFPYNHVKERILNYISSCGISKPKSKLAKIINYISEVGQGVITRRQIENLIEYDLVPIKDASYKPIYTTPQIDKILSDLETSKSEYGTEDEFPDEDEKYRYMTVPVEKASKFFLNKLDDQIGTINSSYEELNEAREIIESDTQKVKEEAKKIANLEHETWIRKKRYTQGITSMQKTANKFGIEL